MAAKKRKAMAGGKRATETREPRATEKPCVLFSFKHFHDADDTGQSLSNWAEDNPGQLAGLLQKMAHISQQTVPEARQDTTLTLYGRFPESANTDFACPRHLQGQKNWGVIRNIGGQKPRAAGFLQGNIFYVVFLDKHHQFYKSSRR
ncbi:hypothetical protein GCM10022228_13740 [Halomonas cibimaris]|uniref:Uncharacterized protein n=1 Tax=Halomonas cibimaris TaxID=657012 RepID=A0ABP7LQ47_9GAMM